MIPMTETPILIETSFAGGIAIIATAEELPEQIKRHWATSLRQIAKALDKPLEVIPARYSAVRADLAQLHQVPAGLTKKTLQNHKSNVKGALLWLAREKGIPEHGAPLTPVWEELRSKIRDGLVRSRLSSLMRFCSANNVAPVEVDEVIVDRFADYRSRAGRPFDRAARRLLARAWNANVGTVPGWPARALVEAPVKAAVEVAWQDFPEGHRPARGRHRDLELCAGPPRQPDRDQARVQLDQAGWPQLELLARLPELRRQEPGQVGISARATHHATDRRLRPRLPARLAAGQERGLVVSGTT
jgi:hypothetical protein